MNNDTKRVVPKLKFTREEDQMLIDIIDKLGTRDWETIAQEMKNRTPRQCRERWNNYLSPSISSEPWTNSDDELLDDLFAEFGTKWSKIAEYFPNRSANGIRNRFKLRQRRILKERRKIEKAKLKNAQTDKKENNDTNIQVINSSNDNNIVHIFDKKNEDLIALFNDGKDLFEEIFNPC